MATAAIGTTKAARMRWAFGSSHAEPRAGRRRSTRGAARQCSAQAAEAGNSVRRPPDKHVRQDASGQNLLNLLVLLGLVELVFENLDVVTLEGRGFLDPLDETANVGFASRAVK